MKREKKISIAKTLTWRIVATSTTFLLTWFFTGDITIGLTVGGAEMIAKMFLYYAHERSWESFLDRRAANQNVS